MSNTSISFHDAVRIETDVSHFPDSIESPGFDRVKITAMDYGSDRIEFTLFAKAGALVDIGSISFNASPPEPAPISCVLDMTREFAKTGIHDEFIGALNEGRTNEQAVEAVVRYLESYGAKFQGEQS